MELSKQQNHRNPKYLKWLRNQNCVIAGRQAHVAHHVNLGTNSGKGIKASDYFCLPLLNEFHTTGLWAVHGIGEATFLKTFKLELHTLFIYYLKNFLKEEHSFHQELNEQECELKKINLLIAAIEERTNRTAKVVTKRKVKPKQEAKTGLISSAPKIKVSETDFYKKARKAKREYDKELRDKNKKRLSEYRKEQYRKAKEFQKSS